MAERADITPELCRQLLRYEPESGKLYWRPRPREMFGTLRSHRTWNTRFAGQEAFTATSRGYRVGCIEYVMVKAHRVAWAIHFGEWPDVIDHINGDPADNRIRNLRSVPQTENLTNLARRSTNVSGVTGVYRAGNRWSAEIKMAGQKRFLGNFRTLEAAAAARHEAEVEMGFHPNHGRDGANAGRS